MVRSLLQPGSCETSLVVQWLRPPVVHTSSAGGLGLIPGLGTKIPNATQVVKKKKKGKQTNKNRLLWEKLWVHAQVDRRTASTIKPRWGMLRGMGTGMGKL